MHERVRKLLSRVSMSVLGVDFRLRVSDPLFDGNRIFIQTRFVAKRSKGGGGKLWKGRKWYLSEHMTDDEIIKTAYLAYETAIKHEAMEGFKIDGKILFNPHVDFEELLKISDREVHREPENPEAPGFFHPLYMDLERPTYKNPLTPDQSSNGAWDLLDTNPPMYSFSIPLAMKLIKMGALSKPINTPEEPDQESETLKIEIHIHAAHS